MSNFQGDVGAHSRGPAKKGHTELSDSPASPHEVHVDPPGRPARSPAGAHPLPPAEDGAEPCWAVVPGAGAGPFRRRRASTAAAGAAGEGKPG